MGFADVSCSVTSHYLTQQGAPHLLSVLFYRVTKSLKVGMLFTVSVIHMMWQTSLPTRKNLTQIASCLHLQRIPLGSVSFLSVGA